MNIEKLRTNHLENPLGYLLDTLSLSWIVTGKNEPDMETKVVIAADAAFAEVLFESEWLEEISALDFQPEISLVPQKRYYWKVIAQASGELLAKSEPAWFETAKQVESWTAQWITPGEDQASQPIVKKQFVLEKEVVAARLYICGLGLYEFEVNGQRTHDEYLLPGYHAYDFWQQYQTFDVTDSLKSGGNALGILLGDGWYKGRFGFDGGYTNLYGDQLKLISELHLAYADGTSEIVGSDDSWLTQPGPVLKSSIYDGEVYDARKEVADWSVYTEDLAGWQKVAVLPDATDQLSARLSPALKYVESLVPEVIQSPAGETILDFKQNMVGWIAFKTQAPDGTEVGYEVGEELQDGCFYNDNLRTAEAKFTYISDGSERIVRPHFTFYGFRYARLSGFDQDVDPADFIGYVIHSDLEVTGKIETANPQVNQLIKNALWGQKGNFLDVPTDCPQRDERMGWTGDAQIFARTASYNMDTPAFYRKFMHDLRLEQEQLDGSIPFVVPMLKPKNSEGGFMGAGAAAWSDAATVIPWVLYEQHGDLSLLSEQYATMVDWVEYVYREDERSGSNRLWTTGFQFGDWLALDGKNPKAPIGGTDPKLVASVYYYYSSTLTAKAAAALGKQADAEKYTALAEDIKAALQAEFLTAKGRLAVNTQTAYVLFLYFDLVPQESLSRVIADFEAKLLEDDVHLKTGFVGTPYLCEALTKSGLTQLAYSILLNEDYPSWLYAVNLGATTIWERWNSVLPDGKISGTDMNSLNHYAYGSIVEWLYRSVLGIQADPEQAGYRHFYLKPVPSAQLGAASGEYDSSSGKIKSDWRILEDGQLHFAFEVPTQSTATIELPHCQAVEIAEQLQILGIAQTEITQKGENVSFTVTGGVYEFTYQPLKSYKVSYSIAMTYKELLAIKATRTVIFDHLPMLKGNDLALNQLDSPFETFSSVPIVQHFVNDRVLGEINEALAKL
jgi:alpha-L-rhamnosidase